MQIAELEDGESIKRLWKIGPCNVVVSQADLGGVSQAPPIQPRHFQNRPNQDMRRREVLQVKESQSLAEDLRFMVFLNSKTLSCMETPETAFEQSQDSSSSINIIG